jgi:hypothetical protein
MQDHEHAGHSNNGGGPAPTANGSTPVSTCKAHGTMRTGGACGQCQPIGSASTRLLGQETAGQQITAQADAGMPNLKELDEPGLIPGAPHPDPVLAAKGWHVCRHGIYTRHPDGPLQAEPEAC